MSPCPDLHPNPAIGGSKCGPIRLLRNKSQNFAVDIFEVTKFSMDSLEIVYCFRSNTLDGTLSMDSMDFVHLFHGLSTDK